MNMNLSCMKIFESIYADYVSLTTTSTLRDMEMTLTRFTRRTEIKSGTGRGEVKGKPAHVSRFPPNARNLIPQMVYDQMKIWFEEMTKPNNKRNPAFFDSFKFIAHKQPVKVIHKSDKNLK